MARICALSDTHGRHNEVDVPECDILIHAGDFSRTGKMVEVVSFLNWFSKQKARHLVYIAGNHDLSYERDIALKTQMLNQYPAIHYLEDSSVVLDGLKIYGSPYSPLFGSWSFMLPRGKSLRDKWSNIPSDSNILAVHSPVYGILDDVGHSGEKAGCYDLLSAVKRVNPSLFISGHIHREKGAVREIKEGLTTFANVSICDDSYTAVHGPMVFDLRVS
jgi:Icc-related predicted phosphoesterase